VSSSLCSSLKIHVYAGYEPESIVRITGMGLEIGIKEIINMDEDFAGQRFNQYRMNSL
jgi:hypothetical protein